MRYSPFVDRIAGEGARAWEIHYRAVKRVRAGEDVIVLSVGDPDFETPAPVVAAAKNALDRGRTHYADIVGELPLRQAIARHHRSITGQEVGPEQIVVLAGAQCALFAAAMCVLGPGDEVVAPEPMYVTYEAVVGATGATLKTVPLRPERAFHLDPEELRAAIGPRTRAILLNSPNNPTGAVMTRAETEAVAEIARAHDLWVLSDEVYASLVFTEDHVSIASLPGMAERTATINSLSKSHAMTGWRVGWMVGPRELAHHVANLALCMLYGSPPFIQDAALAALTKVDAEVARLHETIRARRDMVFDRLARVPGLSVHRPEGSMFMMVDVRRTRLSAFDFADRLLAAEAVAVLPGDAFGPHAAGHVRISLGLDESRLLDACDRIAAFVATLDRHEAG
jgi:arginine:pyruvate transaminase